MASRPKKVQIPKLKLRPVGRAKTTLTLLERLAEKKRSRQKD